MKTFFFVNLYKDNIISDLADTVPGDDIFIISSKKAT